MFEVSRDHELKVVSNIGTDNRNAIVIDNFYDNPDEVRSLALNLSLIHI